MMNGTGNSEIRWRRVAQWAGPLMIVCVLTAMLIAVDPWLAFFPREPGRRLTKGFLRMLLIGYVGALVLIPLTLACTLALVIVARRRGQRRPIGARLALLCGSTMLSVISIELAALAWLAWTHRMPVLPTRFAEVSQGQGDLSVVVLGGSSALGYPYDPTLSVGQIVAWQIEQALPGRRGDLDIRAQMGKNLEDMHKNLVGLKRRPDVMIIYSGHNEFLSRFEDSRAAGYTESPEGNLLQKIYQLSLRSPFCI